VDAPGIDEWERALTELLLMIGEGGDASPIRSFEVGFEELGKALKIAGRMADGDPINLFKASVCNDATFDVLRSGGALRPPGSDVPGVFAYLVLTLVVAGQAGEDLSLSGAYRAKLSDFSGAARSFADLSGVHRMWLGLERWLEQKKNLGLPYRQLVLPKIPEGWNHIGYTLKLAFPARWDETLLTRFLAGKRELIGDVRRFTAEFAPHVERASASSGMRDAFDEFRSAFTSGDRFLADHRFWRLALRCTGRDSRARDSASIECAFDEDARPVFTAVRFD